MKKFILRLLIHLATIFGVYGSIFIIFVITTNPGLVIAYKIAQKLSGIEFSIDEIDGSLARSVILSNVKLKNKEFNLNADSVQFNLRLSKLLFSQKVEFENLALNGMHIDYMLPKNDKEKSILNPLQELNNAVFFPKLSLDLNNYKQLLKYNLNHIEIQNTTINYKGRVYYIGYIRSSLAKINENKLGINTFEAKTSLGELSGKGSIVKTEDKILMSLGLEKAKLKLPVSGGFVQDISFVANLKTELDFSNNLYHFNANEVNGLWNRENFTLNLESTFNRKGLPLKLDVNGKIGSNQVLINHSFNNSKIKSDIKIEALHLDQIINGSKGQLFVDTIINQETGMGLYSSIEAKKVLGVDKLSIIAQGEPDNFTANIDLHNKDLSYTTEIKHKQQDEDYILALTKGSLFLDKIGNFTIDDAIIKLNNRLEARDLCLRYDKSSFCTDISLNKDLSWKTNFKAIDLPLAVLNNLYPLELNMSGKLNFSGDLKSDSNKKLTGTLNGSANNTLISYEDFGIDQYFIPFEEITLASSLDESMDIKLYAKEQENSLEAKINLTPKKDKGIKDAFVECELDINIPSLNSIYESKINYISSGSINNNISITGTLSNPAILISGKLENLRLSLGELGTNLYIDSLNIDHTLKKRNIISGKGEIGGGEFEIFGQSKLSQKNSAINFTIKGNELVLANNEEVYVKASPELNVSLNPSKINVAGTLDLIEANIDLANSTDAINTSDDVIIVDEHIELFKLPGIYSDIIISTKNPISFSGWNLDATLFGSIGIISTPNHSPLANGYLSIKEGTYNIEDNFFNISDSKLVFPGTILANPSLDIKATRIMNMSTLGPLVTSGNKDITVGANITGTFSRPKISFYSTPYMDETEIISFLVTGHSSETLYNNIGTVLVSKLSSLLMKNTDINKTQKNKNNSKWMPDSVSIVTGSDNNLINKNLDAADVTENNSIATNSRLAIGKKINKDVYAVLELGNKVSSLKLKYLLTDYWTAQLLASPDIFGFDLLYSIEI